MKTALILYGFFRTFEDVKESLKQHVIDPLNCDVFFCSFETIEAKKDDAQDNSKLKLVDDKILNFFGSRLKKYELRPHEPNKDRKFIFDKNLPTWIEIAQQETYKIISMQEGLTKSIKIFEQYIKENNEHYDLVILTRPDIKYYTTFNASVLNMKNINCPQHFLNPYIMPDHSIRGNETDINNRKLREGARVFGFDRWLNDQILCGTQENMLVFSNLFDKLVEHVNDGVLLNNETLIGAHLIKNNIQFDGCDFIIYELWRNEYNHL
jgi:hypothetical protein